MKSNVEMVKIDVSIEPDSDKRIRMILYFLRVLYGNITGTWFIIWTKQDKKTHSFPIENRQEIATQALLLSEKKKDVYFSVGLHSQQPPAGKRGAPSYKVSRVPVSSGSEG